MNGLGYILLRETFEFSRSILKVLSDLGSKLDYRKEIANAKSKTHRDIKIAFAPGRVARAGLGEKRTKKTERGMRSRLASQLQYVFGA